MPAQPSLPVRTAILDGETLSLDDDGAPRPFQETMSRFGADVDRRLKAIFTVSAAIAGVAGALFTHTNAYVTLGVFDFEMSAGVLVMLILGGTGRLYGAFVGAVVYMGLQDHLSKLSPAFWQAGIGALLIVTVLFARRGILGLFEDLGRLSRRTWR